MGKKKPQKTKELSVAIAAAASSAAGEAELLQQQQPTPRKRGRPRKIIAVEKTEPAEIPEEEGPRASEADEDKTGPKRAKPGDDEVEGGAEEDKEKDDRRSEEKGPPITRSRARRKSYKPRKSI